MERAHERGRRVDRLAARRVALRALPGGAPRAKRVRRARRAAVRPEADRQPDPAGPARRRGRLVPGAGRARPPRRRGQARPHHRHHRRLPAPGPAGHLLRRSPHPEARPPRREPRRGSLAGGSRQPGGRAARALHDPGLAGVRSGGRRRDPPGFCRSKQTELWLSPLASGILRMSVEASDGAPHTAQCIDRAASGHLRHTFVPALYASWFVTTVFEFAAVVLWALPDGMLRAGADATSWLGIFLVAPIYVLFLLVQLVLSIVITAAVINSVHRRLTGLANLLFFAPLALVAPMSAILAFATALGMSPARDLTPFSEAAVGVALGIISIVAFEATGQAWWQLMVGREAFFSVRAWRPPPFFVLSTFLRQLGLPGYLSFTRGDVKLPLLYFGVAVLNAWVVAALLVVGFLGVPNRDPNTIWIAAVL